MQHLRGAGWVNATGLPDSPRIIHGRRGLRKLFLGSQTSEVLADGSVPVLVVHSRT